MNHHKKIAPKREGPFEIDEVLRPVIYQLKLPESWKIHNVFHATLLRPYIENKIYENNYPRPLPELLEGKEVYEVKTILRHWRRGRGYQYYVKWKGYPITEATWENKSAFSNDGDCRHDSTIQRPLSTIGADWSIKNKRIEEEKR
jgi:Chromo (CHRromatin Organisation MOdifier) domain